METTTGTPKLNEALAKAQAEMRTASKSATNPHFKSKYADLAEVMEVWTDVGPKYGLAIMHEVQDSPAGTMRVRSCLLHTSGEERHSIMTVPVTQATAQAYGSALTYLRRYNTQALTGMVSDEDDDGNAASSPAPKPAPKLVPTPAPTPAPKAHRMTITDVTPAAPSFGELRLALESAPDMGALQVVAAKLASLPGDQKALLRPVYNARVAALSKAVSK